MNAAKKNFLSSEKFLFAALAVKKKNSPLPAECGEKKFIAKIANLTNIHR